MQMKLAAAGLVFLSLAREAAAADSAAPTAPIVPPTGCPVVTPVGAWPQGAIHTAVSAGKPNVDVPPVQLHAGFNRTLTIDGLCADAFTISSGFTCSGLGGETRYTLTAPAAQSPVALRLGAASCPLTAISVYRTGKKARFEAEMRFQFEGCVGAPVSSAAVVVGVRKSDTEDFNLLGWTKEVCKIQGVTPPPSSDTVSHEIETKLQLVGKGKCNGVVRREIKNIADTTACKLQCVSSSTKAQLLGGTGCKGFAFNAKAKDDEAPCITFSGDIVQVKADADGKVDADWTCHNMSFVSAAISKSTPPPVLIPEDTTEVLDLQKVLGTSAYGYMQQISPPADVPSCFQPMWWFTLEDKSGQPSSVPVSAADWDALMALVPEPEVTTSVVSAPVVLDRVIVDTCSKSEGWASEACFVAPIKKTECREEEVTGAIVSGVMTSLLTWLLVGIVFYLYKTTFKGKGDYESLSEPGQGARFCQNSILALLSLVAVLGACLTCWLSMQVLESFLGSTGCYDVNEFLVVILAVMLASSLTIIIIINYMAHMHPSHPHPMVAEAVVVVKPKNTQLMLVQVEDGKAVGTAHHSMTAVSEGNQFHSFNSAPRSDGAGSPMTSNMGGPMVTQ